MPNDYENVNPDGLDAARGCLLAVVLSIVFWVAIWIIFF
jgi:hypothetical protein